MAEFNPSLEKATSYVESRILVNKTGSWQVQVTHVNTFSPENGEPRYIIGLKAMNPHQLSRAVAYLKEGKTAEAVNEQLTTNARMNNSYIPEKDEYINIQVGEVETRSKEIELRVIAFSKQQSNTGHRISLKSFLAEAEKPADALQQASAELADKALI